jgi:hypothetical protein
LLPITSRAGNDRNANTEVLDFMYGWMTSRHEGCVSTTLTDKRLEYCTAGAPVQGSCVTKSRVQADKHGISGVFRIDSARVATRGDRHSLKASGAVNRDATRAQRPGLRGSRNDVGALQSVI